jgi:hypothetical protein
MSRRELSTAIHDQIDDLFIDEEYGKLDEPPHIRLVFIRDGEQIADNLDDGELEDNDMRYLESCRGGIIVTILRDGTYSVRYFTSEDAIEDQWSDMCADVDGGAAPLTVRSLNEDDDGDEGAGDPEEDEDDDIDDDDDDFDDDEE